MRRIIAVIMLALTITMFSGCTAAQQATVPQENMVTISKLKDSKNLEGMAVKLQKDECISDSAVKTDAEVIGAKVGYRFTDAKNADVSIEIYEFDKQNLSEKANETVNSIEKDGKFNVLGREINAKMSTNGKYAIVYTDAKLDSGEENEERQERKDAVLKTFNNWE